MENTKTSKKVFIDNSKLIVESLVRAGADVFIGYPITPANLLYLYSGKRFPTFFAAPDEITTLQWMSGFSATGKLPVTATSFPGYALMIESINMAAMMELPMVIVLVQRLGPATGTATCGAQGDLAVVNGTLSGGFSLPTISVSNSADCWDLPAKALQLSVKLRTPVVLLTSKEEVMTLQSFDIESLNEIKPVTRKYYSDNDEYKPYKPTKNLVPEFLPLSNTKHQVRFTASTHNMNGIIQSTANEALENSMRLNNKIIENIGSFTYYDLDEQNEANTLIISYGLTSASAREAVVELRKSGKKVSLLILKTLLPVPPIYYNIIDKYKHTIIAEENMTGDYRKILFGNRNLKNISGVNSFGKMINPSEIIMEVKKYE